MKTYSFIILFLYCICNVSMANEDSMVQSEDSLSNVLAKTTDPAKRIEILQELCALTTNTPATLKWIQQTRLEARKNNSRENEDWALGHLAVYFYNFEMLDSLIYYTSQSDSLSKVMGKHSSYYYGSQALLCQNLLWIGQREKASDTAIRLFKQAKEENSTNGIINLGETLGLINQQIGQDSIAVTYLKESLDMLIETSGKVPYIIRVLNSIIDSELKLKRFDDARKHIEELQAHLDKMKKNIPNSGMSQLYSSNYLLSEAFYINLFVQLGNADEAKKHLLMAQSYENDINDGYVEHFYKLSLAAYYKLTKQYAQALNIINQAMELNDSPETMKLKAEILFDKGDSREAAIQYRDALEQNESQNVETFIRQISELRAIHDTNQLELEVKELRVKELELEAKQQQLKWSIALTSLFLIILILGTFVFIHTRRLNNELKKDKRALLKSEKELRIARDHAEESDRLKSLFLSNMSHEIRTPLNAIVGFAQLLDIETEEGDERKEFTKVIMDNSALLLNLVNDILDISRLESERYRFSFAEENLAECCRAALTSAEHRVKPGVELRFSPESEDFILNTDKLRLQQVLINLVGNATKFTKQGFIELAFTVDKKNDLVRFTVTDTGCGIPADKQDAIFERFEKLNEYVQGTGLGLSICRIIAERFGGDVILDKKYTGGARFIFTHSLNISQEKDI
ncbi:hypothetical protein H8784_14775 [Parabacteroides acidifaciens]|nr:HAMP domain-containing sensor histidine kinase [Parabacteroides acidifaciens]MBC8602977.1 hypothetical protein [Parabacteroides acidifaciens]